MKRNPNEITPIDLAKDVMVGRAMTSDQIPQELLPTCFMPLMLMSEKQHKEMKNVTLLFSYMSDTFPRSINGYPIFSTMYCWKKEKHEEFIYCIRKLLKEQEKLERRMRKWKKVRKVVMGIITRISRLIARLMKSLR